MTPPVANRPPEVTHHLPRHPGADHHNAVLAAAQARVDELEPKLAAVLEPILRRAGDEAARRFKQFATHHASLHAAGPLTGVQATSTMICVRPRPEEATAIADPDGAPASDLHCTLAFLGEVEGPLDEIREALAGVAGSNGPLTGVVGGYGEFRPPGCGILLPDVPGLVELRCAVTEALVTAGIDYGRDHGFQPHITIDGDPEDGEIDYMLDRAAGQPLHFDALLIVRGDAEAFEVPLVGPRPLTAAGDTPPDWTPPAADELVDTDALAKAFRGKTDPIRLALIEDVLGSVFGTPGVTEEEAIAFYHSPKAFALNEALRSGKKLTAEQQHVINALDAAMRPSEDDLVLWRGVPDATDVFGTSSLSKLEGSIYETAGYLSTSETAETADQFAAGVAGAGDTPLVQEIRVPKGTPMLRVPAGEYGDQQEWLLPRDLRIGMGTAVREDDPFGSQTIYAKSTALNKGKLSPSTAGVAEGAGLSFDVANPLIDGLLAKTGEHITGIADTTQANVMRAVGSAYQEGLTIPDTAKLITQVMHEAAGPRSVMIARCLPGETLIDGAVVRAVTRRWYEGDMAVVRTEAGREFTATPNHPMFTAQGWRGLGELKEGDDLVCYRRDEDAGAAGDEDVYDGPPSLVEIFEAATAVGVVERRTGGEPDFHGDGREGEVDIARPHRELALGYMPVLHQESVEDVLAPSVVTDGALFCSGCGHLLAVEKERCLCGVPSPGAALADDATDQTTGDVECSGEGVDALARMETREYLPLREVVPSRGRLAPVREVVGAGLTEAAAGNTLHSEPFEDGALVHPGTLRDSGRAQAGEIELDRVVSVHRAPFIGFVYNLCTPYGYFTVNGGYTGNTEMASAVNGASLAAAQLVSEHTGVKMTKTWLTAPGALYPRHEEYDGLDGQTVGQDETFTVGEDELQYPGDPDGSPAEVINCRCAMTYSDGSEVEAE